MSLSQFDSLIETLQKQKTNLVNLSTAELIDMLEAMFQATVAISDKWIQNDISNRGLDSNHWDAATSILTGPCLTLRLIQLYLRTLHDIQITKRPKIPGKVVQATPDQISARVFPTNFYDRILFANFSADVLLEPHAELNFTLEYQPKVCLVLGAGNVSSLSIGDVLYKLINERHVVLLKMHPVMPYLTDIAKSIFKVFIDAGFVKIVEADLPQSTYLCHHALIDEIHLTGSDKTFEQIIFGSDALGQQNKLAHKSLLKKPITGELGNVSPVIIVPGEWRAKDIRYQAENLAATLMTNNGFNCASTRVLIQKAGWEQRENLLNALRTVMNNTPQSSAYYPGAVKRLKEVLKLYPETELHGILNENKTPWALLPNLDTEKLNEFCFQNEIFGSFMSETAIAANSVSDYLEKAVSFCNEKLWGTLTATIIVHPSSLKNPQIKKAVEKAIFDLRYGTVAINQFAGINYGISATPWGAYPGSTIYDIQSGNSFVHNTFLLNQPQKTILRGPFRIWPKPVWFPSNKKALRVAKQFLKFCQKSSVSHLLGLLKASFI